MIEQASPVDLSSGALLRRFDPDNRLETFFDLLTEENKRVNLVSRETTRGGLRQLAAESLAGLELLGQDCITGYMDIGSGGGFPSLPIMIAAASSVISLEQVRLVERTQKRAAALRRIVLKLGLKAEIIPRDFPSRETVGAYQLITLRYTKLTPSLLGSILESLAGTGTFIYYAMPELALAHSGFSAVIQPFTLDEPGPEKYLTFIRKSR